MKETGGPETLGRLVAAAQDLVLERHGPDEALRQRLAREAAGRDDRSRRGLPGRWIWAPAVAGLALAAAALAGVFGGGGRDGDGPRLTFTVGEPPAPGALGELMSAPRDRPLPLRFSEGTSVLLGPAARGRVVGLGARGAEVIVEAGRARFEITPRPHGSWSIRTGPFAIRVTGTKFDTEYDPRVDELRLDLHEGHVMVSGCGLGEGRAMGAGERLIASCGHREAVVAPAPAAAAEAPPGEAPGPEPERRRPPAAAAAPGGGAASAGIKSWVELAHEGRYHEAYERVRPELDRRCRQGNATEVRLLGDVARLTDHAAEARRAYLAVRDRFAGTAPSAEAAFALGRLALEADRDRAAAERWFEASLGERPSGAMAPAALGRLMELRLARSDTEGAAVIARRYLERYPDGPMAYEARRLLGIDQGRR